MVIKLGVYLESTPQGGGTYQYNLSILDSLSSYDSSLYIVTVFYLDRGWEKILHNNFKKVHVSNPLFFRGLGKLYKFLDKSKNGLRRSSMIFNPIVSTINKSDCDLIIFPSQDALSYQVNKKSLSSIHDLMHRYEPEFQEYKNGEYERREKHYSLMCKFSDGILVDSEIGKNHVIESYNLSSSRIFVLPFVPPTYLLNSKMVNVKEKYNLPERYLFYPAQFWEHKNHLNLIESFKILIQKGYDINLVLVGSKKNNFNKVIDKINSYKLSNRVFVLGYVSNDEMFSLYKNALMTTFVSLLGPTNIPVMEALTIGSPLICSNVYAMPDQVGDAGLLVNPKDPEDISNKIELLLNDRMLIADLIVKGKKKVDNYTQIEFTHKLKSIIEKILKT